MNLWFRLIGYLLGFWRRAPLEAPFGVSKLRFRVWPSDLDTSLHMNNGRYMTLMDQGRLDLMVRTGLFRAVMRNGWTPVVSVASVRFRRELKLFTPFLLTSRIVAWDDTRVLIEHRLMSRGRDGSERLNAIAIVNAGLYDRKQRAFVPVSKLLATIGIVAESPPLGESERALLKMDEKLKDAGQVAI